MTTNTTPKLKRHITRLKEVEERTKLSPSWIYLKMKRGEFPRNFKIFEGGRASGWYSDEIDAWLESRRTGGLTNGVE